MPSGPSAPPSSCVDAVRALGPAIQARAGVLTGEAAVTIGATNQGMVAGDIVNTASRLQSVAAAGDRARGRGDRAGRVAARSCSRRRASRRSRARRRPVPAWRAVRVVAQRGGRNRSDTLEAPFVGRDEELRQLKDLFAATGRERRPRLVSRRSARPGSARAVSPGSSSSTSTASSSRVWWHAGRSPAYGDGITFWALGEMIRGRAGLAEGDDEATTRARIAETVRDPRQPTRRRPPGSSPPCSPCSASRPGSGRTSCSPPGGRSSSGWPRPRPWSWCSRTSTTPTRACSTSSTT